MDFLSLSNIVLTGIGVHDSSGWQTWRALLRTKHWHFFPAKIPQHLFPLTFPYSWSGFTSVLHLPHLFCWALPSLRTPLRDWWERLYICSWPCHDYWGSGWNSDITRTSFFFWKTWCVTWVKTVFQVFQIKKFKSASDASLEEFKKTHEWTDIKCQFKVLPFKRDFQLSE